MSIAAHKVTGESDKESALVAFVAERMRRDGPMSKSIQIIGRLGLERGLKPVDTERIIRKGEALAERARGTVIEKAILNGDVATASALLAIESNVLHTTDHQKEEGCLSSILELLSPIFGILLLIIPCLPYGLFEWLLDVKGGFSFAAFGLTIVFWIVVLVVLFVVPWKKLRPNRQWLLAPIRFLRKQLRQLEIATRP